MKNWVQNLKDRFKNVITSIIGLAIIGLAGVMFYLGKIDLTAFGAMIALGFTYFVAKNTLLNGVTLGATKFKE